MKKVLFEAVIALSLVAGAISPGIAQDLTPVGQWQSATGESRYEITHCGGEKLCARLVWLRDDAKTDENLKYLNKYVVRGAIQSAENRWQGTVDYAGEKVGGSLTMLGSDRMRLNGCKLLFCETYEFYRL